MSDTYCYIKQVYTQSIAHNKNRNYCYIFWLLTFAIWREYQHWKMYVLGTALLYYMAADDGKFSVQCHMKIMLKLLYWETVILIFCVQKSWDAVQFLYNTVPVRFIVLLPLYMLAYTTYIWQSCIKGLYASVNVYTPWMAKDCIVKICRNVFCS